MLSLINIPHNIQQILTKLIKLSTPLIIHQISYTNDLLI